MSMRHEAAGRPSPDRVERELIDAYRVRGFRELEIFLVTSTSAPAVMDEIGYLREVEFRHEGGGTGKELDIDQFDTDPYCVQIVAWDSQEREIVAMYRAFFGNRARKDPEVALPTARLFEFSSEFLDSYLPRTIELGRSVVNRQAKRRLHGLHAVWSGLGALIGELPDMRYFFGKVTTYDTLSVEARAALFYLMDLYFKDGDGLVHPKPEYRIDHQLPDPELRARFVGNDYRKDFGVVRDLFSSRCESIPPLFISYANLSSTMRVFGSAVNPHFGEVCETAIMVRIEDIREKYRSLFIDSYKSEHTELFARFR